MIWNSSFQNSKYYLQSILKQLSLCYYFEYYKSLPKDPLQVSVKTQTTFNIH